MVKSLLGSVLIALILASCLCIACCIEAVELDVESLSTVESSSVGFHVAAREPELMTDGMTRTGQPRVDLSRLGLLLQLIGFSLIAVIAGILLDRGFTNTLSDRVERWLSNAALKLAEPTVRMGSLRALARLSMSCLPLLLLIVGNLIEVRWLFWLGVSLTSWLLASFSIYRFILRDIPPIERNTRPPVYVLRALGAYSMVEGVYMVYIVVWTFYLVILSGLRPFRKAVALLSGSDMLRKFMLVTGTIAVLSGLILQYAALR